MKQERVSTIGLKSHCRFPKMAYNSSLRTTQTHISNIHLLYKVEHQQ